MLRKRLAWLLWFALLLPFAQVAAAAHELSHVQPAGATTKATATPAACELCSLAAAVSSGGAASTVAVWNGPAAERVLDAIAPVTRAALPAPSFFRSRAPPRA